MKFSIIVPCFNESKNIPLILEKFRSVIKRDDIEVLLVNNGSLDDSKEIMNELVPKYSFARVLDIEKNQGYGFGITSGLSEARGRYIGYTHADMQTDPEDVIKALQLIEDEPDSKNWYIKGRRKGRPLFDQFFTIGMSVFETVYLGESLWDVNAQPNIFHRSFFEEIKSSCPRDFSLDLYLLFAARKRQINVKRFNVEFPNRRHGESSWNTGLASKWKFIKRTFEFSVKLKKEL
jgi:glycosyltransferase involved in cell wall biosynthesis